MFKSTLGTNHSLYGDYEKDWLFCLKVCWNKSSLYNFLLLAKAYQNQDKLFFFLGFFDNISDKMSSKRFTVLNSRNLRSPDFPWNSFDCRIVWKRPKSENLESRWIHHQLIFHLYCKRFIIFLNLISIYRWKMVRYR